MVKHKWDCIGWLQLPIFVPESKKKILVWARQTVILMRQMNEGANLVKAADLEKEIC